MYLIAFVFAAFLGGMVLMRRAKDPAIGLFADKLYDLVTLPLAYARQLQQQATPPAHDDPADEPAPPRPQ